MKKILKYAFLILLVVGFAACKDKKTVETDADEKPFVWPDSIPLVYSIPDSLKTPEDEELIRSLQKIRYDYTDIVDKHLVFRMTREEFLETGLPEAYYDLMVFRTKNYNQFIDKWGPNSDTLSTSWERRRENFRKELLEMPLDAKESTK